MSIKYGVIGPGSEEVIIKQHECAGMRALKSIGWTLKNKGDGWRMYGEQGGCSLPYTFCIKCGVRLDAKAKD